MCCSPPASRYFSTFWAGTPLFYVQNNITCAFRVVFHEYRRSNLYPNSTAAKFRGSSLLPSSSWKVGVHSSVFFWPRVLHSVEYQTSPKVKGDVARPLHLLCVPFACGQFAESDYFSSPERRLLGRASNFKGPIDWVEQNFLRSLHCCTDMTSYSLERVCVFITFRKLQRVFMYKLPST